MCYQSMCTLYSLVCVCVLYLPVHLFTVTLIFYVNHLLLLLLLFFHLFIYLFIYLIVALFFLLLFVLSIISIIIFICIRKSAPQAERHINPPLCVSYPCVHYIHVCVYYSCIYLFTCTFMYSFIVSNFVLFPTFLTVFPPLLSFFLSFLFLISYFYL